MLKISISVKPPMEDVAWLNLCAADATGRAVTALIPARF